MISKSKINERAKMLKRRFDIKLRPIKVLLLSKRNSMSNDEWSLLVAATIQAIEKNPAEYLGEDLPPPDITLQTIRYVFNGFLEDIKIRNVQAFRKNG